MTGTGRETEIWREAKASGRMITWAVLRVVATTRLVVTGQMIADLVILGLAIKAITGAVRRSRQRQPQAADHAQLTE